MSINTNMGFSDDLYSIKGKKGVFTVFLIAGILTIFEITLFYTQIVPSVEGEMNNNIKKISKKIATSINQKNQSIQTKSPLADVAVSQTTKLVFNDVNKGVLKTFATREQELVDSVNRYTVYTGVILLLVIALLLLMIWNSIRNDPRVGTTINGVMQDDEMTESIYTAILTVGALIAFQILFFFFGKQYKYPGTLGSEELSWVIIDGIETNPEIKNLALKQMAQKA